MSSQNPLPSNDSERQLAISAREESIAWPALEALVHCDPAGRGLASFRSAQAPLDAGQLRAAASHLARRGTSVGIVTGFPVQTKTGVTAETDGPPGAPFLARTLADVGIEVFLLSDRYGLPLLSAGCDHWKLDRRMLIKFPFEETEANRAENGGSCDTTTDRWIEQFFTEGAGRRLSHLIAIERPGPSHTLTSLEERQPVSVATRERFLAEVGAADRDVCHNMRGQPIHSVTAKTHRLFEWITRERLKVTTVGIGDGGNEIGLGSFGWETLVEAIPTAPAGRFACRIATDFTLLSGVSDWAAYALALAVCHLRGQGERSRGWDAADQRQLIEAIVRGTDAVDGLTLRREPTVDGLPLDVYLQPLSEMHRVLNHSVS